MNPKTLQNRSLSGLVLLCQRDSLALMVVAVVTYISLTGIVPLTYDEAANYQLFSSHGYAFVLTNYSLPNNHVLFTFLQSLLPGSMVDAAPRCLRIINSITTAALTLVLSRVMQRTIDASGVLPTKYRALLGTAASIGVLFASPLFIIYLFIARGYLLGSVILFGSSLLAIKASRFSPHLLGIGVALAAWCVPTFAFAAPGLALAIFLTAHGSVASRFAKTVLSGVVCSAVLGLVYFPIIGQMQEQSDKWTKPLPFGGFTWSHLGLATSLASSWAGALLLISTLVAVAFGLYRKGPTSLLRLALAMTAAALSFYLVAEVLNATGLCPAPFLRNALFIPPFIWTALFVAALACANKPLTAAAFAILLANAGINLSEFYSSFIRGDPNTFPTFSIQSATPFERAWKSLAAPEEQIYCGGNAIPVCQAYGPLVARHVNFVREIPKMPCLQGHWPPSDETGVLVLRGDKAFRLCF